jgi:CheY-like chemotaxis protein
MTTDRLTIVLAEDDDGHATLIRRNLERSRLRAEIVRARDGTEALEALGGGHEAVQAGRRVILLLDISMPRTDGLEVLRRVKSDAATWSIPVYMLTTTDNPVEIDRCFELGCNAYLSKPVAYDAFVAAMKRLCEFLEVSHAPALPERRQDVSA